jgi:hypothetical protein
VDSASPSHTSQPPQSPGLAPSDFWLFSVLKMSLPEGDSFASMEDINWNAVAEFQKIPKEASSRCFPTLQVTR